jgi:hypothetical protein
VSFRAPSAVQSTCHADASIATTPLSRTNLSASIRCRCPIRTTSVMRRSCSGSAWVTVGSGTWSAEPLD